MMRKHPGAVVQMLATLPSETPLDLGYNLLAPPLLASAYLLLGEDELAAGTISRARELAAVQANGRAQARLAVAASMVSGSSVELGLAVTETWQHGQLALLEAADALVPRLPVFGHVPVEIHQSIDRWPARWLPILRHQLGGGNVPAAHLSAELLDQHGEEEDIGRLRAFDRTYRRRRRPPVGKALSRRLSPASSTADDLWPQQAHHCDAGNPRQSRPAKADVTTVLPPNQAKLHCDA